MLRIYGRFFARCRKCNSLLKVQLDTGLMDHSSVRNRSMGPEFSYLMDESYECNCGNIFRIDIEAIEYPVGTVESVKYDLIGQVEASNEPQIRAYISPEEELQSDNAMNGEIDPVAIIHQMNDRQLEFFAASCIY